MENSKKITVQVEVNSPVEKVWEYWNEPEHIKGWAFASDDWEAYDVENDLKSGGKFKTVMAAKNKSESFDFTGIYDQITDQELIEYTMSDGREVSVKFEATDGKTKITETFDPETENSEDVQREGWQAILFNFRKYTEKK